MAAASAPVGWGRLPAVSWLMVRAFTRHRVLAVLAFPTALLSLAPSVIRRAAHETADRNGLVVFGRYRPVADALVSIAVTVPVVLLAVVAAVWVALSGLLGAVLVLAALLGGAVGAGPCWSGPPSPRPSARRRLPGGGGR
ncbi:MULTISPECIES: hypothetical protein [unclassified Rathayibacter]|uniref:hypothetical protein n=1 Tax=unclassified Rathayibacter TaxID=2609250 RepID=UPI0011B0193B|nr:MULTISPECIES: hypothetical protein [unclassified Rathayibacter]